MKKVKEEKAIRELLGATQEDMALLLFVTRSRYSLFELKKRNLPRKAMTRLSEMLSFIQKAKSDAKKNDKTSTEEFQKKKELIEKEIKNNLYQQYKLEKKLFSLEKKNQKGLAAIHLADYLAQNDDFGKELANNFREKAHYDLKKSSFEIREKHKLKLLALKAYHKELNKAMSDLKL
jgi:transcriptional regulator with XRE-family HTH domain